MFDPSHQPSQAVPSRPGGAGEGGRLQVAGWEHRLAGYQAFKVIGLHRAKGGESALKHDVQAGSDWGCHFSWTRLWNINSSLLMNW